MQPGLSWDFLIFSKNNFPPKRVHGLGNFCFFLYPQNLFIAENFLFYSFFSPKMLPLALGNFTYPTSPNDLFLKGKKLGFSSVYSTICANFLGKNHQIF
jgi:hypothetical protein